MLKKLPVISLRDTWDLRVSDLLIIRLQKLL